MTAGGGMLKLEFKVELRLSLKLSSFMLSFARVTTSRAETDCAGVGLLSAEAAGCCGLGGGGAGLIGLAETSDTGFAWKN